jgi:hypothetical protein
MRDNALFTREGFTLAAPFLLLLGAAFVSWPWRALNLPGVIGDLAPPSIIMLMAVVVAGAFSMSRRLPMGLITWPPAGLGALFFLVGGFATGDLGSEGELLVILAYIAVLGFAIVISIALSAHGMSYSVILLILFLMAVFIVRFPIFETEAPELAVPATLLTALSALRAVVEIAVLLWLVERLVLRIDTSPAHIAGAMAALLLAHGPLAAWQEPLRAGESLTLGNYFPEALQWVQLAMMHLGVVMIIVRLRLGFNRIAAVEEARPTALEPDPREGAGPEAEAMSIDEPSARETTYSKSGRPTPRNRRRKH